MPAKNLLKEGQLGAVAQLRCFLPSPFSRAWIISIFDDWIASFQPAWSETCKTGDGSERHTLGQTRQTENRSETFSIDFFVAFIGRPVMAEVSVSIASPTEDLQSALALDGGPRREGCSGKDQPTLG